MNSVTNSRSLGQVESVHYILNTFTKILRNIVIAIEFNKDISPELIISLLESAHTKFAALRLCTVENDNIPYFISNVPFSAIPIKIIHNNCVSNKLLTVEIENETNEKIDSTQSMLRAKIISQPSSNILILTLHHSIFDGKSINILLNHFKNKDFIVKDFSQIYPAIETSIKLDNSVIQTTEKRVQILKEWPVFKTCEIEEQKSKCAIIEINHIKVDLLKQFCRQNKITINHIITALTIKTISEIVPNKNELVVHSPIDLRKYNKDINHANELGCFISIIHTIVKEFKNKSIIDIAIRFAINFSDDLNTISTTDTFNYVELKEMLINKFNKKTENFSGGIAISNIGEMNIDTAMIKDLYFTTSLLGGLGIFLLSILTINNTLKLTLSYTSPLVSEDFITSFIITFQTLSKKLAIDIADLSLI